MKKRLIKNSADLNPRRSFIKKLGLGILATTAYTVISITPFACKHEPLEPSNKGGY